MRLLRITAGAALVLGVSACGAAPLGELQAVQPQGPDFTRQLATDYRGLAEFERDQYDWNSTRTFAAKGLAAAQGRIVAPAEPDREFSTPDVAIHEARDARAELVRLLDAGGRAQYPEAASRAQVSYDCWLEQVEEGHQEDHIAKCRRDFYTALNLMRAGLVQQAAVQPEEVEPPQVSMALDRFQVFFDFDEAELDTAAQRIVDAAATQAESLDFPVVVATGHADRAGPIPYNEQLSRERAEAVRQALVAQGVPEDRIRIQAEGELDPVVPTGDEVPEPQNRRVTIQLMAGPA